MYRIDKAFLAILALTLAEMEKNAIKKQLKSNSRCVLFSRMKGMERKFFFCIAFMCHCQHRCKM